MGVGIIADDFTSAMDASSPFAESGHSTLVAIADRLPAGDVFAVDIDSRSADVGTATMRAYEWGQRMAAAAVLVKTIDSTLRGHLAAEVGAVKKAAQRRLVIVAPAFPAAGRVTVDGIQILDGRPVHETEFASDPRQPVGGSDLAQIFSPVARAVGCRRAGSKEPLPAGGVIISDAQSDRDLDHLVAFAAHHPDVLWVGSPGLVQALARAGVDRTRRTRRTVATRVAVVVGSGQPRSLTQCKRLEATRVTAIPALNVADDDSSHDSPRIFVVKPSARSRDARISDGEARQTLDALARQVRSLVDHRGVDGIVISGGETAHAIAMHLEGEYVELLSEPEPGIALGRLFGQRRLSIVTKAGGFGDAQCLVRLTDLLLSGIDGE